MPPGARTEEGGRGGRSGRSRERRRHRGNSNNNNNNNRKRKSSGNDASASNRGGMPMTCCTSNAVRKMLLAEPYEGPMLVFLHVPPTTSSSNASDFRVGQICDDSLQAFVLVSSSMYSSLNANVSNNNSQWALVQVSGYVTSTVNALGIGGPNNNYPNFQPFLCLTNFTESTTPVSRQSSSLAWHQIVQGKKTLLSMEPQANSTTNHSNKVKGGTSAEFLHQYLAALSNDALMGKAHVPIVHPTQQHPPPQEQREFDSNQVIVKDFLVHHKAMKTLQDSTLMISHSHSAASSNASTSPSNHANTTTVENDNDENETPQESETAQTSTTDNSSTSQASKAQEPEQQKQQHDLYFAALREFASSQLDRQKASLTSNAGRANAEDAAKVVVQYKETLAKVLEQTRQQEQKTISSSPWITRQSLQEWHGILCGNGLHSRAGLFRTNTVKAGRTVFLPADQVLSQLQQNVLPVLATLEQRLEKCNSAQACLTFAAAVFFGIVDCHAFADGNGRLARLLTNGALSRLEFPFSIINWFATPAQRREYVLAIMTTRRNLTLVYRGEEAAAKAIVARVLPATGVYFPLVALLMDRVRKAIPEFLQVQHDKQGWAREQEEARAARRFRERAQTGSCLICFDDNPNIATLCCGKAVHLSCIAEWLSSNSSCPNCRGNFPALPPRPARQTTSEGEDMDDTTAFDTTEFDDNFSDSTTDDDEDDTEIEPAERARISRLIGRIQEAAEEAANQLLEDSTTEDDVDEDDTAEVVVVNQQQQNQQQQQQEDDETTDDTLDEETTTVVVARAGNYHPAADTEDDTDDTTEEVMANPGGPNEDDTTTEEDTEDSTGAAHASSANNNSGGHILCRNCRNRAAQECTNTCCGRCCLLHGRWECFRHSS